jgi:hypothetical protein
VALVVATVAVLLAGLVSVAGLTASTTNSPSDIVRDLLQATAAGNVSRALDTLDPAERGAIAPSLSTILDDLRRIGVVDQSADLSNVTGVVASFRRVSTRTESLAALRPGLAAVVFTGGTATLQVTTADLPLGALFAGVASKLVPSVITRTFALGGPGAAQRPLVTIQRNGAWYVSLGYTVAEQARRAAGLPLPSAAESVPARGAASPDALARALVSAATTGDERTLVELTDPLEDGALHDYAPLFLSNRRPSAPRLVVTQLGLASTPVKGGVLVTITDFTASLSNGDEVALTSAGCFVLRHRVGRTEQLCEPSGSNLLAGYGIVAVERQGAWFVDPYRSVLDDLDHVLRGVDLDKIARLAHGDATAVLRDVTTFLGAAAHLSPLPSNTPTTRPASR